MKKLMAMFLAATMAASLAACGGSSTATTTAAPAAPAETQAAAGETQAAAPAETEAAAPANAGGIFHSVEAFPYASLDVHKDYYSWHTQFYGISETLFKINDDLSISPWLAEGMEVNDNVATIPEGWRMLLQRKPAYRGHGQEKYRETRHRELQIYLHA